jgi:hypothetical protein
MLRSWRRGAIVALAAGTAIAAQLVTIAPAHAAGPTVTITATSKFREVTNDVFVVYRAGAYSNATIRGTVSGGSAGEVATLFAQQFPFKKPPVKAGSVTLTAAKTNYSFTVTPNLYTKYAVKVYASKTATTALATSAVRNVYILSGGSVNSPQSCVQGTCHETFRIYWNVPPSTLSTEIGKHVYPYFAVNLNATKVPPPPNYLYLNGEHASVAKARRINDYTFEVTVSYWFSFGRDFYDFEWTACAKDTVYKDGLGLPGSHSCGLSRIPRTFTYLG